MRLRRDFQLSGDPAPDELLTSVRAVVFRRDRVVVVADRDGSHHVMPGGRREAGESELETLGRELGEETGWAIASAVRLGYLAFEHLTPKPDGYPYPFPRFVQSLFVVEAEGFRRGRIRRDDWETHSRMAPLTRAHTLIRPDQRPLLQAAEALRQTTAASAPWDA